MKSDNRLLLMKGSVAVVLTLGRIAASQPEVRTIIQRSVEANERDWNAAPAYSHSERVSGDAGTKTYEVTMVLGTPYRRLLAVNSHPLLPRERNEEDQKLEETIVARRSESPQARTERIARYERVRKRDHLLIGQLTDAFDFRLLGQQRLGPYQCYVLQATPRPGYRPPNTETQVLTGMRGKLWVDIDSYQWVKVEAGVLHPVSIEGFLARVEPGTRFELEKVPVGNGVWLPKHFSMIARATILFVFTHRTQEDHTYSNYRKTVSPGNGPARAGSPQGGQPWAPVNRTFLSRARSRPMLLPAVRQSSRRRSSSHSATAMRGGHGRRDGAHSATIYLGRRILVAPIDKNFLQDSLGIVVLTC